MTENPAIHRHPSGDVDIALPNDEPEADAVRSDAPADNTPTDSGKAQPG
ncbi:hypothetical protein [Frankia sp. Cppng1_Ct_nod]|nr:hypothetical protein [Frankia sp. Cppng1_Ct_nod]